MAKRRSGSWTLPILSPRWAAAAIVVLFVLTTGCRSVLTGTGLTRQIDGSINDSDAATNTAGNYSSQGATAGRTDGLSEAKSEAPSHKQVKGLVRLQLTPNSPGPFTGVPSGAANQKVRSQFTLRKPTRLEWDVAPHFVQVHINSGGRITVNVAMWVLDGTGAGATSVAGSVWTARYTFQEDPNDPASIKVSGSRSDGSTLTVDLPDGRGVIDSSFQPPPFQVRAGTYTAQYELNIQATGDTDYTLVEAKDNFDLKKVR